MRLLVLFSIVAPAAGQESPVGESQGASVIDSRSAAALVRPIRYRIVITPDPETLRFAGEIHLRFESLQPTREIALNSVGLVIRSAQLDELGKQDFRLDESRQLVLFDLNNALKPGTHDLIVYYEGRIIDGLGGFFRPVEKGLAPQAAPIYGSSCCIAMARRIAPVWDQPDLKAVFELELIVDEHADAVANMPVQSRSPTEGGKLRIAFQPTPRMSTHQFFFAVGSFERLSGKAGTVDLGVLLPRGTVGDGRYALAATGEILEYLGDRLKLPYPLSKLDSVGLPVLSAGAIEYWGSILYSNRYLAVGEAGSSARELQAGYRHIAHELSHQWFGNLVTAHDWRHNWLNEGLAEWMASEVTDHFHPEWQVWLDQAKAREEVMRLDAGSMSHPVVLRSVNIADQGAAFDSFMYAKGSQIVRMLEGFAGKEAFNTALRAYLQRYAYGNVTSDDLWRELSARVPVIVEQIGRDFTEQEGVPLIDVLSTRCVDGHTVVELRQGQFGLSGDARDSLSWHVPVTVLSLRTHQVRTVIVHGSDPSTVSLAECGPVKVNVSGIGYFRTRYDRASIEALTDGFARLPSADQLNLLLDQFALAVAGCQDIARYLELVTRLTRDSEEQVKAQWMRAAAELEGYLAGTADQEVFRAFALNTLGKAFTEARVDSVGTSQSAVPSGANADLRERILQTLRTQLSAWLRSRSN